MKQRALFLLVAGALVALPLLGAEHESKRLGLRYRLPENFATGELKQEPDAEVLIERRLADGQDLKALPLGKLSVIQITRSRGEDAELLRKLMLKDPFRQTIGSWAVYVLPGYPGPYGDKALYYLVPLKDGSILEILAPKFYIEDAPQERPTQYEPVIRELIESLEVIQPWKPLAARGSRAWSPARP